MAKIIKSPDIFQKVICQGCGCEYEYEKGDTIATQFFIHSNHTRRVRMLLECPVCATSNVIHERYIEDKEQNNETN